MATVVEISKVGLETCSPLNLKHNILYHRVRDNVNQRHIQKPWFDLNPMIDKDDDKGMDLETYRPEDDHGVQALESLTIVEDFSSDAPLFTRQFKIGQFWEFLFSEDWSDGYSLRILEGRLQNLMFTCLLTLTQTGHVTKHSTRAFAKNRRKRYAIYKGSTKPLELGRYEETLLLEFRYYGLTVDIQEGLTEYPNETTCSTVTTVSSELDSSEQDIMPTKCPMVGLKPHPPGSRKPPTSKYRRKLQHRRTTLPQSPGRGHVLVNKGLSRVLEAEHKGAMIPRGTWKREHRSDISTGSDECPYVTQRLDLSKFMCTEKLSYLGEFELSDDSSSEEEGEEEVDEEDDEEEEEPDYGQGLYIGDRGAGEPHVPIESVEAYLRRRKGVLQDDRQQRRKLLQEMNKLSIPLFPEFFDIDLAKLKLTIEYPDMKIECATEDAENVSDQKKVEPKKKEEKDLGPKKVIHIPDHVREVVKIWGMKKDGKRTDLNNVETVQDLKVVKKVPDLEEYVKVMKKGPKVQRRPVYKPMPPKARPMTKCNVIRPYIDNERFADLVGGVTSSNACRMHCYGKDNIWNLMSDNTRKDFLIKKLVAAGANIQFKPKKKIKARRRMKPNTEPPLMYVTTPLGITYLHPASRQLLMKKLKKTDKKAKPEIRTGPRRLLLPGGQSPLIAELKKKWNLSVGTHQADSRKNSPNSALPYMAQSASWKSTPKSAPLARQQATSRKSTPKSASMTVSQPASRKSISKSASQPTSREPALKFASLATRRPALEESTSRSASQAVPRPASPGSSTKSSAMKKDSGRLFPKARPLVTGTESPDEDSDDEDDDLEDSPFDTNKLSIQYSLERIRKTTFARRKRNNKALSEFYQVLKKYYRMQSILRAFTPGPRRGSSVVGYRNSISSGLPKQRKLKQSFFKPLRTLIQVKKDMTDVGKMKWFPFLEAKRKLAEPEDDMDDEHFFENYPMDLFRKNLKRALEMFVVRREVVISDYNAKASVSITMTKKSVFVKSRNPHM